MLCEIAGFLTELPDGCGLEQRCKAYLLPGKSARKPQITIQTSQFRSDVFPDLSGDMLAYVESGRLFHRALPQYNAIMLHASAVAVEGGVYLFSASSGTGKSTHAGFWLELLGSRAEILNDDKPTLRLQDGVWRAYGTPWCGKDGINRNESGPLAGICFLRQAEKDRITRLDAKTALFFLLENSMHRLPPPLVDLSLRLFEQMIDRVPMFLLENRPTVEAAKLSYETMRTAREAL